MNQNKKFQNKNIILDKPTLKKQPPRKIDLVSAILTKVLKQAGIHDEMMKYRFVNDWDKIVGSAISKRSRPESLKNQILTIRVVSPVWAQELNFRKSVIIKRLKRFLDDKQEVRDIRFYVGEL
jgi:hypothetical protein